MNIIHTHKPHRICKLARVTLLLFFILALAACSNGDSVKKVRALKDIEGSRIGVQLGTTSDILSSELERKSPATRVERFNKSADAVQALTQGKIDCAIMDEQPAKAFCQSTPQLEILPEEFGHDDMAICIARDNASLLRDINLALEDLHSAGVDTAIINAHIERGASVAYKKDETLKRDGVIRFGVNATFKPFEYYDKGRIVGIDIDLAQAICDRLGRNMEIVDMEFDAIITSVQAGKVDAGISGITVTEERKKNVSFSHPYAAVSQVVVVNGGEVEAHSGIVEQFKSCFVTDGRYHYLLQGLGNTLVITLFAAILSLLLGTVIAIVRATHQRNGNMRLLNMLCQLYIGIVRGTPTMVQVLIIYYVVFAAANVDKILVAVIAFGLNSAAYIAEVIRSGIMSVDTGQMEAGRSLGLSYGKTMRLIILPQAFKNVLPALGNELITLLKETSISGYIGLVDLTKGSDIIRSITYNAILPLGVVACIYLTIVMALSFGISMLEKRLRRNERRQ
jgi:polar amino acid transport system substrate-binding protein